MNQATPTLDQQVRTLQIIVSALAMGVLVLAAIVVVAIPGEPQDDGVLDSMGLVAGLVCLAVHRPVGAMLLSQARTPGQRMNVYTTSTIVSAAILEGGAFFNVIAYMIERSNWSLAMAGLLWAAILFKMPTRQRVHAWLDQQELRAEDEAAWRDAT